MHLCCNEGTFTALDCLKGHETLRKTQEHAFEDVNRQHWNFYSLINTLNLLLFLHFSLRFSNLVCFCRFRL